MMQNKEIKIKKRDLRKNNTPQEKINDNFRGNRSIFDMIHSIVLISGSYPKEIINLK